MTDNAIDITEELRIRRKLIRSDGSLDDVKAYELACEALKGLAASQARAAHIARVMKFLQSTGTNTLREALASAGLTLEEWLAQGESTDGD